MVSAVTIGSSIVSGGGVKIGQTQKPSRLNWPCHCTFHSRAVIMVQTCIRGVGRSVVEHYRRSVMMHYGRSVVEHYGRSVVERYGRSVVVHYGRSVVMHYGRSVVALWEVCGRV